MKRASALLGLVVAWILLSGEATWPNLIAAGVMAVVSLLVVRFPHERGIPRLHPVRTLRFALWFSARLVQASGRIAMETLRRTPKRDAAIVRVPLDRPVWEVIAVANLITLIPGTIAVEISDDPRQIYVHGLFLTDPEEIRIEVEAVARRLEGVRG